MIFIVKQQSLCSNTDVKKVGEKLTDLQRNFLKNEV
jgi:hypothetical protein